MRSLRNQSGRVSVLDRIHSKTEFHPRPSYTEGRLEVRLSHLAELGKRHRLRRRDGSGVPLCLLNDHDHHVSSLVAEPDMHAARHESLTELVPAVVPVTEGDL